MNEVYCRCFVIFIDSAIIALLSYDTRSAIICELSISFFSLQNYVISNKRIQLETLPTNSISSRLAIFFGMARVETLRNAQTQHGDYRSVDEENIVVLRKCFSPPPVVMNTESDTDEGGEVKCVWFEAFNSIGASCEAEKSTEIDEVSTF